ncbi:hypothetical protein DVS77_04080 [Mycolicibacterium moriokaense]|nr:hypothetical protein DVS77_04080 [Mycolicibacterium moriokaense]
MRAIDDARAAGFEVSQDLSVINRSIGGSKVEQIIREAEAHTHESAIRMRAEMLAAVDSEVARRVTAAIADVDGAVFEDTYVAAGERSAFQAVDYAPLPNAPIPDPGVPGDPAGSGAGPTGAEIWSVIDKLPQGNRPWIREVRTPQDLQRFWEWMKQSGSAKTDPYDGTGKGVEFYLPDGSRIGQRLRGDSTGKPTIDINVRGKFVKVHINPRGGIPEIPAAGLEAQAPQLASPTESSAARGGGVPGRVMGGGILPDNTLPHFIQPPQTKESPVIGDGIPDAEP